jgi:hypothetical protein
MAFAAANVVRLTLCPRCNYDLGALPRRHRCPECGFEYDENMFLLEGWVLLGAWGLARWLLVSSPLALFLLGFLRVGLGLSWKFLLSLLLAFALITALVYLFAAWRDQSGRRVLVRYLVTNDGVSRPGKHIYLWRNYSHTSLLPDGRGGWRLHLYPVWWRVAGPPLVNARLDCLESEAQALRDEIQHRINTARRADAGGDPPYWQK